MGEAGGPHNDDDDDGLLGLSDSLLHPLFDVLFTLGGVLYSSGTLQLYKTKR